MKKTIATFLLLSMPLLGFSCQGKGSHIRPPGQPAPVPTIRTSPWPPELD